MIQSLSRCLLCIVATFVLVTGAQTLSAQNSSNIRGANQNTQQLPQRAPAKPTRKKKSEIETPEPEVLSLTTKDGVQLKCTFYGAPVDGAVEEGGKIAIPFILVHDWEGDRTDCLPFAAYLQSLGCAVIVPDLRGHGESVNQTGASKKLDYSKFRKSDFATVPFDLERCKKYLVQKNNAGELNIDLLNIVAVGHSSVFAVQWTISDWSWPNQGSIKQGKDVKSVVLVSPRKKLKNIGLMPMLKNPLFSARMGNSLPTMVVWSSGDSEVVKDCEAIYEFMEKSRPDPEDIEDPKKKAEATTLMKARIPRSRLSGTELIRDNQIDGLYKYMAQFVATKVGSKRESYKWQNRSRD